MRAGAAWFAAAALSSYSSPSSFVPRRSTAWLATWLTASSGTRFAGVFLSRLHPRVVTPKRFEREARTNEFCRLRSVFRDDRKISKNFLFVIEFNIFNFFFLSFWTIVHSYKLIRRVFYFSPFLFFLVLQHPFTFALFAHFFFLTSRLCEQSRGLLVTDECARSLVERWSACLMSRCAGRRARRVGFVVVGMSLRVPSGTSTAVFSIPGYNSTYDSYPGKCRTRVLPELRPYGWCRCLYIFSVFSKLPARALLLVRNSTMKRAIVE